MLFNMARIVLLRLFVVLAFLNVVGKLISYPIVLLMMYAGMGFLEL